MATNFSPCKGSYVLNQFPSNVMFGMNGFHVSASGAIQGHHGPLVFLDSVISDFEVEKLKHIYFTSIEKQVLTTYTNLSRFCFLGTTPVLAPNVWANENPKVDTRPRESNKKKAFQNETKQYFFR